ncbi:MAG TPA: hypothetical protein HA349_08075 [Methanotrichaceae archaeon]|nr:hypothetical protein [Methanotrichaceae archaeon]
MLTIVSFFFIPTSWAQEGSDWDLDFGDRFELNLDAEFATDMNLNENLAGEISNDSYNTNGTTEPALGQLLVMENLSALLPDSNGTGEDANRHRGANFSFELPPGWKATCDGDRNEGKLTLKGPCTLTSIGWFEDSGVDPESILRQVGKAYRSGSLRFPVLTAEQGETVAVDGQSASSLNVYYRYGGDESQKRLVAWNSPVSGRFFYASFWSCAETWDENLEMFEEVLGSFRDERSERYVVLEPRSTTLDGWGTILQETLKSYHFKSVATPPNPEVGVKVVMKTHREGGQVNQLASEEIVSLTRGTYDPPRERSLQKQLIDRGYGAAILRRGGAFWVVVKDAEGNWQAISSAAPGTEKGLGTLVPPDENEWYRGLVVDGSKGTTGENASQDQAVIEKDCDPPRQVHLKPMTEVNLTWILDLRDLLDLYSYSQEGTDPGSFQRAQVCWALLEREGYDARLVTGYEGHTLHPGMWVVVRHPGEEGHIAVKTAVDGDHRGLGEIVCSAERFEGIAYETCLQYSCLHPENGLSIDPGAVRTPAQGRTKSIARSEKL